MDRLWHQYRDIWVHLTPRGPDPSYFILSVHTCLGRYRLSKLGFKKCIYTTYLKIISPKEFSKKNTKIKITFFLEVLPSCNFAGSQRMLWTGSGINIATFESTLPRAARIILSDHMSELRNTWYLIKRYQFCKFQTSILEDPENSSKNITGARRNLENSASLFFGQKKDWIWHSGELLF